MNILQHCPTILLQNLSLATSATFWFHNACNIGECCVASVSKNVPHVAVALCTLVDCDLIVLGTAVYLDSKLHWISYLIDSSMIPN